MRGTQDTIKNLHGYAGRQDAIVKRRGISGIDKDGLDQGIDVPGDGPKH